MIKRKQNAHESLRYIHSEFLFDNPKYLSIISKEESELTQEESDVRLLGHNIVWMRKCGERVFSVDSNLLDLLRLTDLSKMPSEFFKPPFPCQFFDCRLREDAKIVVSGFYLTFITFDDNPKKAEEYGFNRDEVCISIMPVGYYKDRPEWVSNFQELRVTLPIGGDILPSIEDQINFHNSEARVYVYGMFKLVFNLVLYINSTRTKTMESWKDIDSKIDTLSNKEREKVKLDLRRKYILCEKIGTDIVLDGKTREAIKSHNASSGKMLSVRFIVRGHWRHQWMGSDAQGNRRQELKWIQPFWKGDPLAEVSNKPYHLVAP